MTRFFKHQIALNDGTDTYIEIDTYSKSVMLQMFLDNLFDNLTTKLR